MDFAAVTRWASVLFTPSDFLWLLLVLGLLLQWTRRKRLGWALVIGVATFLGLTLIFPLDRWLAQPLEDRFPRPSWPAHVDGIVVLGGGENGAIFSARGVQAPDPAEGRLIAGADLARRYPDAKLIFSGGTAALAQGTLAEADIARAIFAEMGIPQSRVIAERRSRNTWEDLLYSKQIAKPRPAEVWLLVTSALHLPRAMGVAAKLHWRVTPWAADYMTTGRAEDESWNESLAVRLEKLELVAHEWAGLAVYRLTGRWASSG
jgi:uncharacterized SAM-binding protein YcdF (DUF218 family)